MIYELDGDYHLNRLKLEYYEGDDETPAFLSDTPDTHATTDRFL